MELPFAVAVEFPVPGVHPDKVTVAVPAVTDAISDNPETEVPPSLLTTTEYGFVNVAYDCVAGMLLTPMIGTVATDTSGVAQEGPPEHDPPGTLIEALFLTCCKGGAVIDPTVPVSANVTPSPLFGKLGIVCGLTEVGKLFAGGQMPPPIGVHEFQTTDVSPDTNTLETGIPVSDALPAFITVTA